MTYILVFIGSFITAFSGALAPGPLLTVTVAESVRKGPIAGPLLISGHSGLEMGLTFILLSGISSYLKTDLIMVITGIAGSVVLLYMGITTLRNVSGMKVISRSDNRNIDGNSGSAGSLMLKGAVVSLSNPYWLIWWLTIGSAFLSRAIVQGYLNVVAFFVGHISADFLWYGLISAGVHFGRKKSGENLLKAVYILCGIFLIMLALYFGYDGVRRVVV